MARDGNRRIQEVDQRAKGRCHFPCFYAEQASEYGIDDVDEELLIRYVNEGIDQGRLDFLHRDVQTTLAKLDLVQGDHLNQAGYYLFSKHKPLLLKLAIFPTEERISFVDMKQFRGNIFECIQEAMRYIKQNIRWQAEIKGMKRVETPEIPLEAIREIVVNSFAHMRVNPSISNEIYLTPTRVRIYNWLCLCVFTPFRRGDCRKTKEE